MKTSMDVHRKIWKKIHRNAGCGCLAGGMVAGSRLLPSGVPQLEGTARGRATRKPRRSLPWISLQFPFHQKHEFYKQKLFLKIPEVGIPGWCSGLAPAFGPGRDPGDPGSNPASGSLHGACFSLCLCLCLSFSVSLLINK